MKIYRRHNCRDRHTSWPDLAACIWPTAAVVGDGQYAAVSCGARAIVLCASLGQARARTYDYDRDSCRPGCHQHHNVVALDLAPEPMAPRVVTPTTTPVPPSPPKPEKPICGRPRTNGQPCHRSPGWGADPGEEHCVDHGGSVTARTAETERRADQALVFARLAEKARTTPLTAEEEQQAEAAVRGVLGARAGRRGSSEAALAVLAGWPLCLPALEVPGLELRSLGLLIAALLRGSAGVVS